MGLPESWNNDSTDGLPDVPLDSPRSNLVFGRQMEHLFGQYLKHHPNIELLGHNLQLTHDGKTLGELDFLMKELDSQRFVHLELACKFYLYDAQVGQNQLEHWIGVNRRDSLVDKLDKLANKQLPLIGHTATKELLANLEIEPGTIDSKVCFKAQLFAPWEMEVKLSTGLNKACLAGFWLTERQFNNAGFEKNTFAVPDKSDWLCSVECELSLDRASALIQEKLEAKRSPLVLMRKPTGQIVKFFVVWW